MSATEKTNTMEYYTTSTKRNLLLKKIFYPIEWIVRDLRVCGISTPLKLYVLPRKL